MYARLTIVFLIFSFAAKAQNMNMPYSIYGLGEIDRKPYDRTQGMGGTGLALQSPFYVLQGNPAATSALIRSFYQIDIATTDIESMKKYNYVRKAFYKNDFPAATWVQVVRLFMPDAKLEVEVIAHLKDEK